MKRRLLAIALVMMLFIGMMPTQIWANPTTYEYEIQAVIADENGGWVSTNSLPSKNFKGTTESGSGYVIMMIGSGNRKTVDTPLHVKAIPMLTPLVI